MRCAAAGGRGRGEAARKRQKRRRGKGGTDENATGKSYRDTTNPRHGTWATLRFICVHALVRVRSAGRVTGVKSREGKSRVPSDLTTFQDPSGRGASSGM